MPGRSIQPLEIFSQLYIGDYFADTLEFSAEEHAALRLLLLHIWLDRSEPLEDLGSIAQVSADKWQEIAPSVLPLFLTARANIETWKAALKPFDGMRLPPETWHIVRTIILERDGYICQYCGNTHRLHVDHKIPFDPGRFKRVRKSGDILRALQPVERTEAAGRLASSRPAAG